MDNVFLYKNSFLLHNHVKSILGFGHYDNCTTPRISIILPVYNRPGTLESALKSAINQDNFNDYEIVIVDNNETHPSPNLEVIKRVASSSSNVFYYQHEKNIGMYGNFNRGVQLARGEYITFCHDDDLLDPNAMGMLSSMIPLLNNGECVIGEHRTIDEEDNVLSENTMNNLPLLKKKSFFKYSMFDMFVRGAGIGGGGSLFQRDRIIELGGFREDLYPGSDYALFINYQYHYGCYYLTTPTYNYRKAENESKKVFMQFPLLDRFFMECMKPYIKMPDLILNLIIRVKHRTSVASLSEEWDENTSESGLPLFLSRKIYSIFRGLSKIKAYTV